MSSSRKVRRPVCEIRGCGSTRLHDGDDGYRYCDQGHQQSSQGTQVVEDTGELIQQGKKTRRKADSDAESTISRGSFDGPRAFEHYLLCLQLILRKQLRWLVEVQKLPLELETLVRDLWALRLQRLQTRVSYDSGTDTEGQSQLFSSQSETEKTGSESGMSRRQRKRQEEQQLSQSQGTRIGLIDTLTLCYLGTLLLRIPLTVGNLHTWAKDGQMPYYSAWREVPVGMRERLPAEFQAAMEPGVLMDPEKLHQKVLDTFALLHSHFGMGIPPINHPLVLYHWMVELALPIEVFAATQRLARLLEFDFAFSLKPRVKSSVLLRQPEVRLMALLVVSTKLFFPFDDIERAPAANEDLDALKLQWNSWVELQSDENSGKRETLSFADAFEMDQDGCLGASNEMLDEYLLWYQRNIASESVRERGRAGQDAEFRRALFRLFPTRSIEENSQPPTTGGTQLSSPVLNRLRQVQGLLKPKKIVRGPGTNGNRVGSFYRRYRTSEELEGPVKTFFERAALLGGVSIRAMVEAVFRIEKKLEKLEEGLRREEALSDEDPPYYLAHPDYYGWIWGCQSRYAVNRTQVGWVFSN